MTLMSWIHGKITGCRHRDVVGEALAATDEATNRTRSVRQQLEPYRLEDDPFVSMTRNRLLAEEFARRQSGAG